MTPPSDAQAPNAPLPRSLSVRALLEERVLGLDLSLLAGDGGLDRVVGHARIQKSGLALAGHYHGIVPSRVQILGQTELSFLETLHRPELSGRLSSFFGLGLACVIVTHADAHEPPTPSRKAVLDALVASADAADAPLLASSARSSVTITALHALLDDRLAPRLRLHGVLVDVFGVGLLLMGQSAIGKSESALDLVMRGHRLVADDVVECDYRPPGMVFGAPADLLRHHLEVRGLGILNVKDLFGVAAVRERKRIDVVVRLVEWSQDIEYDRLGLDERFHSILGLPIRELVIPVRPGRDMASILEVAARNELLKIAGHHAAHDFFASLEGSLVSEGPASPLGRRTPRPSSVAPRIIPRAPESSAELPRAERPKP